MIELRFIFGIIDIIMGVFLIQYKDKHEIIAYLLIFGGITVSLLNIFGFLPDKTSINNSFVV
tara:strand:+ start:95 stop:280 length:186 start_codon:yes stop_codon:yes gene_type:complete